MKTTTAPAQILDHHNECVGCGAHISDPCHPACGFLTGEFGPAIVLRAASRQITSHPAGVGYDIRAAIFDVAITLVGPDQAQQLADATTAALADYLVAQWGERAEAIRREVVFRLGLFSDTDMIAVALYGAAALHDGIAFNPDDVL